MAVCERVRAASPLDALRSLCGLFIPLFCGLFAGLFGDVWRRPKLAAGQSHVTSASHSVEIGRRPNATKNGCIWSQLVDPFASASSQEVPNPR
jgi:hypothetical protein